MQQNVKFNNGKNSDAWKQNIDWKGEENREQLQAHRYSELLPESMKMWYCCLWEGCLLLPWSGEQGAGKTFIKAEALCHQLFVRKISLGKYSFTLPCYLQALWGFYMSLQSNQLKEKWGRREMIPLKKIKKKICWGGTLVP